ncbi:Clp protease N-terminal domain-containing protein [Thermogemmatispora tikiterensis]|uniref:Clp R domain-containing protein n=1 Tax=Thermogemmatispora tikiterensis TaxID=1825093 RepID=A0A328VLR5_9CHLR|nr:Clp protease N-terminal domain-containing protein [Thermogemmatispora tikiterensis]RAQ97152.1 hypothetical protein A4R35_16555 [Thermogemmatispora tikiterensis]
MQQKSERGNDWGARRIPAFGRYSYRAKATLAAATYHALRAGRVWLDGHDLLLSLLDEPGEVIGSLLLRLGVDRARLAQVLGQGQQAEASMWEVDQIHEGLTPLARQILRAAVAEADSLQHTRIEPGHLFLGVLACRLNPLMSVLPAPEVALSLARAQVWATLQPAATTGQLAGQSVEPELVLLDLERQVQLKIELQQASGHLLLWRLLIGALSVFGLLILNSNNALGVPLPFDLSNWFAALERGGPLAWQPLPGWQPLFSVTVLLGVWLLLVVLTLLLVMLASFQTLTIEGILGQRRDLFWRAWGQAVLAWTGVYLVGVILASLLKALLPFWWWLLLWLLFVCFNLGQAAWGKRPFPWNGWPVQQWPSGEVVQRCADLLARRQLRARFCVLGSSVLLPAAILLATGWAGRLTIYLSETLLQAFPPEEVEILLAIAVAPYTARGLALRRPLLFSLHWLPLLAVVGLVGWFLAPGPLGVELLQLFSLPGCFLALGVGLLCLLTYRLLRIGGTYACDRQALQLTGNVLAFKNALVRLININGQLASGALFTPFLERLKRADLFLIQQGYQGRQAVAFSVEREER